MYPSRRIEGQFILVLLAPLAVIAAMTQFAPLDPSLRFVSNTYAVRNVCNAALSILFAIFLAIWGFIVNDKHVWRTDGGMAIFGASAIVLWQTFLGWWWWVRAGMGMGEVNEWVQHAEKR